MKTLLGKLTLGAGGLLVAAAATLAGPLQRADVPADPAWLVHLDCDAVRPSAIGKFLLSEMDKPEARAKLAAFQTMVGVDVTKQIHGATLFGTGPKPEDGVLIVYADFDPERLTTIATGAHDHQSTNYNGIVIHNWMDDKRVYGAIKGSRVILGQRESALIAALDVLAGAAPNLATSKNFSQLGTAGGKPYLLAAARKLNLPDTDPNAAVFRLSKQMRLEIGEAEGKVFATLALEANEEEVAQHMASIAQGLMALLKLQNKPDINKIVDAVSLKQDGASVVVKFNLAAAEVVDTIKTEAAKKAAQKAEKE